MKVNNITELVGNTPIVQINKLAPENSATIWGKLEYYNPAGSVKDRIGLNMILDAEKQGTLKPGDTIIEPTSGNTGIALAFIAAQKGYRLILVMPETMSKERRAILKAYGAELVLVKPEEGPGMTGAIKRANEYVNKFGYFMPSQFQNPANPESHFMATGPEIVEAFKDTGLDYFVSGVGTGGTILGAGKVLKKHFPKIKISAVEPVASPILSGGQPGKHTIQGIGAGFIPEILDTTIYDNIIQVGDIEAKEMANRLAKEEGLLLGISSGAAMVAALQVSKSLGPDKQVLVILPDGGERYLSTGLFD